MLLSEKPFIQQVWWNDDGEALPLQRVPPLLLDVGFLVVACDLHSLASTYSVVPESSSPFSQVELYNHLSLSSRILLISVSFWTKAFTLDALHI